MRSPSIFSLWAATQVFYTLALAQRPIDLSKVSIKNVNITGTGCPPGSAIYNGLISGSQLVTIVAPWNATFGPTTTDDDSLKKVRIQAAINYPAGLQYTIQNYTYEVQATLDDRIQATHKSTYWFTDQSIESVREDVFNGPINATLDGKDALTANDAVWSPCGAPVPLDLTFQLRVKTRNNADDSASGTLISSGVFNTWLAWRPC